VVGAQRFDLVTMPVMSSSPQPRRRIALLAATTIAAALPFVVGVTPASAATIPSGFTDVKVGNVSLPVGMDSLPDGRLLVTSQGGRLTLMRANGTIATTAALDLTARICSNSERGLLGITSDPSFATNHYVYTYYTSRSGTNACDSGAFNRVSRFTMAGDTIDPATEQVLLDNIPSPAGNHNGGDLHIGKDGYLYVSVGDGGCYVRDITKCAAANTAARDMSVTSGKILRITVDGGIPPSNPFSGASTTRCNTAGRTNPGTTCQEIFAFGLRNPFRFSPDQNAVGTRFFVNDVGQDTTEEIDELKDTSGGADFGWNTREGTCVTGSTTNCPLPPAGVTDPVHAYTHVSTGCESITGGAFVPTGQWPLAYDGGYLFADYICGKIFLLHPNGSSWTRTEFATAVGGVTVLRMVEENGGWSLYYGTYANGGELHRITADADVPPATPAKFVPITPERVLDTRNNIGSSAGKLTAGGTLSVQIGGGTVPTSAVAVAANITSTNSTAPGFLTVWPGRSPRPDTSTLNFQATGETVANEAIVRLGSGGVLNVYSNAGADVLADITGYWVSTATSSDGRFVPVTVPTRLLDTREGIGTTKHQVQAGETIDLTVGGAGSPVPATGVSAVALTVTADAPTRGGYVTVWPSGVTRPVVSSVNTNGANDTRSNLVVVPVGANGKVSLYSLQPLQLVVDVTGWFTDTSAPASTTGLFKAASPARLLDTRKAGAPFGRLNAGDTGVINYTAAVDPGAIAIVHNLTLDRTHGPSYLTAFPSGSARPTASNVNITAAAQSRATLAISRLGTAQSVSYFASDALDLVIDRSGWFIG
jgi:glucose/arabinose dehydrogenase